jgi:putative membrane protein
MEFRNRRLSVSYTRGLLCAGVYLTVIILFLLAIVLFSIQNVQSVTMSFLGFSIRAPLAILTAVVYVLGAITVGSLSAALRKSIRVTRASWPATKQQGI